MLAAAHDQAAVNKLVLVDAVGATSDWLSRLHSSAIARLGGDRRAALAKLDPSRLEVGDIASHAEYASALYPAWFADREFGAIFSSPRANSPTGAAVAARLRRDGYDWTSTVASIRVPTLVVHGKEDLLSVDVARFIVSLIRDSELALLPHAGHMPFWEQPEEFFSVVEKFLTD